MLSHLEEDLSKLINTFIINSEFCAQIVCCTSGLKYNPIGQVHDAVYSPMFLKPLTFPQNTWIYAAINSHPN